VNTPSPRRSARLNASANASPTSALRFSPDSESASGADESDGYPEEISFEHSFETLRERISGVLSAVRRRQTAG
jgi:hypothetical protein